MKLELSSDFKKKLEDEMKNQAVTCGKIITDAMEDKYKSLIDNYYKTYTPQKYHRINQLYDSYQRLLDDDDSGSIICGIKITADGLSMYEEKRKNNKIHKFSPQRVLDKYVIFGGNPPYFTFHGGDYHGGYGEKSEVNIYQEMKLFKKELLKSIY